MRTSACKRRRFCHTVQALADDNGGVAAIEFALLTLVLATSLLNSADLATYLLDRLQVENAAQMGAQAAWQACDLNHIPATTNCPGLNSAVSTGIQRTSLGTSVRLVSGSPSEGYYCVNSSGSLQYVSDVAHKPSDCSAAGTPSNPPADYISIQTTYTYAPLFRGLSIGGLLETPITRTTWMRMG